MKRRAFLTAIGAAGASGAALRANAQVRVPVPIQQPAPFPNTFLQQYTIGVCVTLSGPLGKYGNEVVRGVQAAVERSQPLHDTDRSRVGHAHLRRPQRHGAGSF